MALDNTRGTILSRLVLSESLRRQTAEEQQRPPEQLVDRLNRAVSVAQQARESAEEIGERERQVEALIEEGCAWRDLLRLTTNNRFLNEDPVRLARKATQCLEQAAQLATSEYRTVDALVNLAYVAYEQQDLARAASAAQRAYDAFPSAYKVDKTTGRISASEEDTEPLFWSQLGKLSVLLGKIDALQLAATNVPQRREALLRSMAEHFLFSLAFNLRYSPAYPGLTQTRENIYRTLKALSLDDLVAFTRNVQSIGARVSFEHSGELQRLMKKRTIWREF